MRSVRFAIPAALLLFPAVVAGQQERPEKALGVRFVRGEPLPAPFGLSIVSATADGLVALTVDDRLAGRTSVGREPQSTSEFYAPDDVLQWTAGINSLLAWMRSSTGPEGTPSFTLGSPDGVVVEIRGVVTDGRREGVFRLNRCRESADRRSIDVKALNAIAARFRRAALRAGETRYVSPPDDALWYGHAVGCPARSEYQNVPAPWPNAVKTLRPHQEIIQFVVDATGRVEPGSERFMASSDPRFAASIRRVLPSWRFKPARRMSRPVRQVMHVNVGFTPPLVPGPGGSCSDERSKGVVARLAPGSRSRFRPDQELLRGIEAAFVRTPVVDDLHGMTLRYEYDRFNRWSNLRLLTSDGARTPNPNLYNAIRNALGQAPALPASAGFDTVYFEVEFGQRCAIISSAAATNDLVSMLPQGDGMIRIANGPEASGFHLVREPSHTAVTIPARVFSRFVDTVHQLLPALDTAGSVANGPDYAPGVTMVGTEEGLGLHMWLSRTGWIRAGFMCGRPGMGSARFFEVRPAEFAVFRKTAVEALSRMPRQPAWTARSDAPYLEHELTCHPVPDGHHLLPTLHGIDQTSIETTVQVTIDDHGNVEPAGVEIMQRLDPATQSALVAALERWTFQPAVANGMRVRAKTHINLILRAPEADAVMLASLERELTTADTVQRTVFYRPSAPPPPVAPLITPDRLRLAFPILQPQIDRARDTWQEARRRYVAGLPLGYQLVVTTLVEDNLGNSTFAFIRVERVADGTIYGHVWRDIPIASEWKRGDPHLIAERDLLDWAIIAPDGAAEGNFLGRLLGTGIGRR